MSLKIGEPFRAEFSINSTDLAANNGFEMIAPNDGYVMEVGVTVQAAVTTGGTITVKTGSALGTTVAGLSITVASAATKGTRYTGTSTPKDNTRAVLKGDRIAITTASFATAGALNGYVMFSPSGAV
jgi:hypothetical protein